MQREKEGNIMVEFAQINKNPKGRKTGDCSTRALCNVLQISYEEALKLQYEMALKCYYDMTSKEVIERILKEKGYQFEGERRGTMGGIGGNKGKMRSDVIIF